MELKAFKKITKSLFEAYGFTCDGTYYYLDLPEVAIICWMNYEYYSHVLRYNISLKKLHQESDRKPKNPFDGYDIALTNTHSLKTKWEPILYKELSESEYEEDLKERLHRYFDPYKGDVEKYLLYTQTEEAKSRGDFIAMTVRMKRYFGIPNGFDNYDVTFNPEGGVESWKPKDSK